MKRKEGERLPECVPWFLCIEQVKITLKAEENLTPFCSRLLKMIALVWLSPTRGGAMSICQGGLVRQRKALKFSISEQLYLVLLRHGWDQEVAAEWPSSLAEGAPCWEAKWSWSKAYRAKVGSPLNESQNWLPSTELLLGGAVFPGVLVFYCCVTNDHKLSSLTQYTCLISWFLWSKV